MDKINLSREEEYFLGAGAIAATDLLANSIDSVGPIARAGIAISAVGVPLSALIASAEGEISIQQGVLIAGGVVVGVSLAAIGTRATIGFLTSFAL